MSANCEVCAQEINKYAFIQLFFFYCVSSFFACPKKWRRKRKETWKLNQLPEILVCASFLLVAAKNWGQRYEFSPHSIFAYVCIHHSHSQIENVFNVLLSSRFFYSHSKNVLNTRSHSRSHEHPTPLVAFQLCILCRCARVRELRRPIASERSSDFSFSKRIKASRFECLSKA